MGLRRRIGSALAVTFLALGLGALSGSAQPPTVDFKWVTDEYKPIGLRSIPSESMLPTLLVGDRVVIGAQGAPRRGDVVIFQHPHSDRVMIARIVGLPGDTVQMKGGKLILNGEVVPLTLVRKITYLPDDSRMERTAMEYSEQLPGEARPHLIHEWSDEADLDETPLFKVPEGRLFMMGDNRDNSEDSRSPSGHREMAKQFPDAWPWRGTYLGDPRDDAIGFVPVENLLGQAVTVVLSIRLCKTEPGTECLVPNIGKRL